MSAKSRRRIDAEQVGDVTVVTFLDRKILDEQNIATIGEQLFSLVDEMGCRKMVINLSSVEYLASLALQKLITLQKVIDRAKGKLVLCQMDPEIYEVFQITQMHRLFTIVPTKEEALQAF